MTEKEMLAICSRLRTPEEVAELHRLTIPCDDCGMRWLADPPPVLKNELWDKITKDITIKWWAFKPFQKATLCVACTVKRLGRPIQPDDLIGGAPVYLRRGGTV